MKNLIEKYEEIIVKCEDSIERMEEMINIGENEDGTIDIDDLTEEIGMARHQIRMYNLFIKEIKECDLVKACTELNKGDGFAHVQDVVTMISKAGNLIEIKATNEGYKEPIANTMQNIANNIKASLPIKSK